MNKRHDLSSRFSTLAHELGHIYCGHLGAGPNGAGPNCAGPNGSWPSRPLSRGLCEIEAEAVAWIVCRRNGVESKSTEYLNQYVQEEDMSLVSMYGIFEAANRVEAR